MDIGEDKEYLFAYERSRFHSAVTGVIVSSILTAALGVFVWPVLRDMNGRWSDMFQSAALALGGVLSVVLIVLLYFFLRLIVSFVHYSHGLRQHKRLVIGPVVGVI